MKFLKRFKPWHDYYPPSSESGSDAIGSQWVAGSPAAHFPQKRVLATGYDEPTLTWLAERILSAWGLCWSFGDCLCLQPNTPASMTSVADGWFPDQDRPPPKWRCLWRSALGRYWLKLYQWVNCTFANWMSNFLLGACSSPLCWDCRRYWSLPFILLSTRTFEIAATLRSIPRDFTALARQMDTINLKTKLQGYVYDHLEIDEHGAARVTLNTRALEEFDLRDSETAAIVRAPGRIDTVSVWAIFVEQADGHFRVGCVAEKWSTSIANDIMRPPTSQWANSYSLEGKRQNLQELQVARTNEGWERFLNLLSWLQGFIWSFLW